MTDLLIHDLDDKVFNNLSNQANAQGTSIETYAKQILTNTITTSQQLCRAELIKKTKLFSEKVGPQKSDSTQLIREDRDR